MAVGAVVTLLGSIFSAVLADLDVASKNQHSLLEIDSKWNLTHQRQINQGAILNVLESLSATDSVAATVGQTALNDFFQKVRITENSFSASSEYLAIRAYEGFCRVLVEEQKKRASTKGTNLVMKITHSGPIDVWLRKEADLILQLQKEFVRKGGRVVRILIDSHGREEELGQYAEVYEIMNSSRIHPFYLAPSNGDRFREDLPDFIMVENFDYVMIWETDSDGSRLAGCRIELDSDGDFGREWIKWSSFLMDQTLPVKFNRTLKDQERMLEDESVRRLFGVD